MNRAEIRKKLKQISHEERKIPKTPLFNPDPKGHHISNQANHIAKLAFVSGFLDQTYIATNIILLVESECKKAELKARHETEEYLERWLLSHGIDPLNCKDNVQRSPVSAKELTKKLLNAPIADEGFVEKLADKLQHHVSSEVKR